MIIDKELVFPLRYSINLVYSVLIILQYLKTF